MIRVTQEGGENINFLSEFSMQKLGCYAFTLAALGKRVRGRVAKSKLEKTTNNRSHSLEKIGDHLPYLW